MTVIRLNNGGAIQVRTGVLQGIGPIGPQGVAGPKGDQGDPGPQGNTGPIGAILQYATVAKVQVGGFSVTKDTDTLVAFPTVQVDDLSAATSSTNYTIRATGVYMVTAWVKYENATNGGDGPRSLWITSSTRGTLARDGVLAVADEATYVQVNWPDYYQAGEVVNIKARQGDDLSVTLSDGGLSIVRVGSGPQGPVGPTGPQGSVGPQGVQGPAGPTGNAASGFLHYSDLL